MFSFIKKFFKINNEINDLAKQVRSYKKFFKETNLLKYDLLHVELYIIHNSIIDYLKFNQSFLTEPNINELNILLHESRSTYSKYLLTHDNKFIIDHEDYFLELIEQILQMIELYNNKESINLKRYIIHTVTILESIVKSSTKED